MLFIWESHKFMLTCNVIFKMFIPINDFKYLSVHNWEEIWFLWFQPAHYKPCAAASSNKHYLIAELVIVGTLNGPKFRTFHGLPLYVAIPSQVIRRSGWICSQIFFFGFNISSGSPAIYNHSIVTPNLITVTETIHNDKDRAQLKSFINSIHFAADSIYNCQ